MTTRKSTTIARVQRLAWLLDNSIPIPGTRIRFGLDPILGLIPGLGDAIGTVLSGYIVVEAARLGASGATLFRMVWNVLVEAAIGIVPLLGDLFDAAWKANARNLALLERQVVAPELVGRRSTVFVALLAAGTATLVAALLAVSYLLIRWLFVQV